MSNLLTASRHEVIEHADLFSFLRIRWANWLIRRKVRQMQLLDNRTLLDIGVDRDEVYWASRLPLTVNAGIALDRRARERRKAETGYLKEKARALPEA